MSDNVFKSSHWRANVWLLNQLYLSIKGTLIKLKSVRLNYTNHRPMQNSHVQLTGTVTTKDFKKQLKILL